MSDRWIPPLLGRHLDGGVLWNAFVALSGQTVPIGESGASFVFSLCEAPAAQAWIAEIIVAGIAEPFLLHVRDFPFRALFDVDLDMANLGALPDGLRQALLEGIFASVCAYVSPGHPEKLRLGNQGLASTFPAYGSTETQWFAVTLQQPDGNTIELVAGAERGAAVRLLDNSLSLAAPLHAELSQNVMIHADMTIGSIALRYGELSALEPGAVIVMAERPEGTLAMRAEDLLFEFVRTEEGWRCQGCDAATMHCASVQIHGGTMSEDPSSDDAAEPVSISDLSVTIDFDIGRMRVPVSALAEWREGTTVPLEPPAIDDGLPVTIRANGDVAGFGDVVRIDDRIAVRITRLLLRG